MKFALIVCVVFLAACSNSYREGGYPVRPEWAKDCKIAILNNESGGSITIARCPNSTTTTSYKSGKTTATTIVVDGVEYVQSEK